MEVDTGCVYFIRETVDTLPGLVKIGKAKCTADRARQLQCGNPRPLTCYKYIETSIPLMSELEKCLHSLFAEYNTRTRYGKKSATEWFILPHGSITVDNIIAALEYGRQHRVPVRAVVHALASNRATIMTMDSYRPVEIETILQRAIPYSEFGTAHYTLNVKNGDATAPSPALSEIDRKKAWAAAEYRSLHSRVTRAWVRGKGDPAIAQRGTDIIYTLDMLERNASCRVDTIDGEEILSCVDTVAEMEREVAKWTETVAAYEEMCGVKKVKPSAVNIEP